MQRGESYTPSAPSWIEGFQFPAWLSFVSYLVAYILLIVALSGSHWYVSPEQPYEINGVYREPPDPIEFGLFWLCHRGHCVFSMNVDYRVVGQIQDPDVQEAYQKFRTPVVAVLTVAFIFGTVGLASYLIFLTGQRYSPFFGFGAAGLPLLAGVTAIIACIIFGDKFRGKFQELPFGRSFWLCVIAGSMCIINGAFMVFLSLATFRRQMSAGGRKTGFITLPCFK